MADPMTGPITRCPWCSAELPAPDANRCPSCQAQLTSATGTEPQLPGVTTLDAEAILKARAELARPRSRLLSFITGEAPTETAGPASPDSLAPPSGDVRREMLRLQIEAEVADLEAETVALKADVLAEQGISLAELAAADAEAGAGAPVAASARVASPAPPTAPATAPAPSSATVATPSPAAPAPTSATEPSPAESAPPA
jgi:hypothetical protein